MIPVDIRAILLYAGHWDVVRPDMTPDPEPGTPVEPVSPIEIFEIVIEPETSKHARLWVTLGAIMLVVSAVLIWVLIAKFFTWSITLAIFGTITLILVLISLLHRHR